MSGGKAHEHTISRHEWEIFQKLMIRGDIFLTGIWLLIVCAACSPLKMAVGCMVMVDALSSGVTYSTSPNEDSNTLLINATWGLGKAIVEGQTDGDFYKVKKGTVPELIEVRGEEKNARIKPAS